MPSMEHVMLLSALRSRYFKRNQKCLLCPRASDGPHSASECPTLRARGEAWRRWQACPPAHQRDPILPDSRTLYPADGDPRSERCASEPARGHKRPCRTDSAYLPINVRRFVSIQLNELWVRAQPQVIWVRCLFACLLNSASDILSPLPMTRICNVDRMT
jgi:hypothetical protein